MAEERGAETSRWKIALLGSGGVIDKSHENDLQKRRWTKIAFPGCACPWFNDGFVVKDHVTHY